MRKSILFAAGILSLAMLVPLKSQAQGAPGDREKFRAAMEACFEENGLARPERGQRPSAAERAALDTCMKDKGFERPAGPPPGGHHGRRGQGGPPPIESQEAEAMR